MERRRDSCDGEKENRWYDGLTCRLYVCGGFGTIYTGLETPREHPAGVVSTLPFTGILLTGLVIAKVIGTGLSWKRGIR